MSALPLNVANSDSKSKASTWLGTSIIAVAVTATFVIPGAIYFRRKKNVSFLARSVAPRRQPSANTILPALPLNSRPQLSPSKSPVVETPLLRHEKVKNASAETGPSLDFSPALYALRALGMATIFVSIGSLAAFWAVKEAMDVKDTLEFERRMRQFILTRMPILSSRIHRTLEEEDESDAVTGSSMASVDWNWEDAEKRLQDVYEKEGVSAWIETAAKELYAEERVARLKRKELEEVSREKF
ncbi:hypothetical protein D9757_001201 [Collybiopsis confluens]|uniref:Uncharacterized protein n=1 Tax=Collybiopsis confluens TaxID=2823264 RepID=A0A8H5MGJ5_9AGAR|nr:hypothetical protein D9757_001201 [Collybiopsis confluens]